MGKLSQDLRFAFRMLVRQPGFTAIALIALALGIGANTAVFSLVYSVLIAPLPFREPDRLVSLYEQRLKQGRIRNAVSPPDFMDWKQRSRSFESMEALSGGALNLTGQGEPERLAGLTVTPGFWALFGLKPILGRDFLPEEATQGRDNVVLLARSVWRRRFNSDPNVIGRSIMLSGRARTVVGVMPHAVQTMFTRQEVYTPLVFAADESRSFHYLNVFGRLKPGVTIEQARAELRQIGSDLEKQYPQANEGHSVTAFDLTGEVVGPAASWLWLLMGAAALVLLVACANVANLILVRNIGRKREIAIRTAIGASRATLARQLLTESLLLGTIGGSLGLLIGYWALKAAPLLSSLGLPRLSNIALHGPVLFFAIGATLLTSVLFGLAPVIQSARVREHDQLKDSSQRSGSRSGGLARKSLVTVEVALSVLLLTGAGLLLRSLANLLSVNPGFRTQNVLAMDVPLSAQRYPEAKRAAFYQSAIAQLSAVPGVESVAATTAVPLGQFDPGRSFTIPGRPPVTRANAPNARFRMISADYFKTLDIPLRAGREFTASDSASSPQVVVINETLARQFWPDEIPLGKHIQLVGSDTPAEIIGIAADVKHQGLNAAVRGELFLAMTQFPEAEMTLLIRSSVDSESLAKVATNVITGLDREQPVANVRTLASMVDRAVAMPRSFTGLLALFATLAVILASVGIYGVVSFATSQRRREIGVRMSLGATAGQVVRLILGQGLQPVIIGTLAGIAGALALGNVLRSFLFQVGTFDAVTLAAASLVILLAALVANYGPALRASRTDPAVVLREE